MAGDLKYPATGLSSFSNVDLANIWNAITGLGGTPKPNIYTVIAEPLVAPFDTLIFDIQTLLDPLYTGNIVLKMITIEFCQFTLNNPPAEQPVFIQNPQSGERNFLYNIPAIVPFNYGYVMLNHNITAVQNCMINTAFTDYYYTNAPLTTPEYKLSLPIAGNIQLKFFSPANMQFNGAGAFVNKITFEVIEAN